MRTIQMMRKEINDRLVAWITERVKKEYADAVSLVAVYGSHINGTANEKSDVDCYFVPKTARGYRMALDFIIDGVGYDLYPVTWERLSRIADLEESMSPLVGDARLLFTDTEETAARFCALRERMLAHFADDAYGKRIARARCRLAGERLLRLPSCQNDGETRLVIGGVITALADAVAVFHHTYYHFGIKRQYEDLRSTIAGVPPLFAEEYRMAICAETVTGAVSAAKRFYHAVCAYLAVDAHIESGNRDCTVCDSVSCGQPECNAPLLAAFYEEVSATFQKIYVACDAGNAITAYHAAVSLQSDFYDLAGEGCPQYNLLEGFSAGDLMAFSDLVKQTETDFVKKLSDAGGIVKRYADFDAFLRADL